MEKRELEIYVHIPFCVRKCAYCDFLSFPAFEQTHRAYTDALLREISRFEEPGRYEVVSVYFGGGTPSLLRPEFVKTLINEAKNLFNLSNDCEITLESNPSNEN